MRDKLKTAAIVATLLVQAPSAGAAPYKPAQWIVVGGGDSEMMSVDYNRVKRNGSTYGMPAAIRRSYGTETFWFWVGCETRSHMTISQSGVASSWLIAAPGSAAENVLDLVCKTSTTPVALRRSGDVTPRSLGLVNQEPSLSDAPTLQPLVVMPDGTLIDQLEGFEALRNLCQNASGVAISKPDCDRLQQGLPPIRLNTRTP